MKKTIEKENYLKSIYKLQEKKEDITVTALSIIFNVSKSTVSNMLKKLVKMGLVNTSPYKPIKLTSLGKKKAVEIISKHRLIELYLVKEMNFKIDEVHDIAEEIEHIENSEFFNRMRKILGDDFIEQVPDDNFEKTITEVDEKNLKQLLKQDLNDNHTEHIDDKDDTDDDDDNENKKKEVISINSNFIEQKNESTNNSIGNNSIGSKSIRKSSSTSNVRRESNSTLNKDRQLLNEIAQSGGDKQVSPSSKELNSKILNIINDKNLELSDNNTSEKKIENKKLSETSSEELISNNMDSNLKKLIKDDLGNTESESSTNFKPENTKNGYQEIFSNSNHENSTNSQQKNDEINKNKFFNNYLQF